jgi:hypothetical protein
MEAAFGYIIKKSFINDDFTNWIVKANDFEEIKKQNFYNSFLSDDYVFSRYLDKHNIKKRVLNYTLFLNKMNCFIQGKNMEGNDALCGLGHNLDKYVKSEIELKIRHLI